MRDDAQLLRDYVETGSEPAFRELVERHLPMVNATARRLAGGDTHLAQDVAQLVFTDLARKAAALPPGVVLGGWLHRHACFTAAKAVRAECRRRARERTAMELTAINDQPGADALWTTVAPVLDEALNRLDPADRDALVLRFLQQQDFRSVGRTLGTSDDTAQKRVSRALDKLRGLLTRRGMAVASAAALATTLEAAPLAPVTPGLAAAVSAHALSTAATAGATTLTLASLKTMISSKLALGLAATAALAATAVVITHQKQNSATPSPAAQTSPGVQIPAVSAKTPAITINAQRIASANQVEAPKAAPAPAGDKPATPDDLAASTTPTPWNGAFSQIGQVGTGQLVFSGSAVQISGGNRRMASGNGMGAVVLNGSAQGASPNGTAVVFTNPTNGATVMLNPAAAGINHFVTSTSGPDGTVSRSVSISNGQMTVTETKDGVTTTTTSAAPPPGGLPLPPLPDGTATTTMTIVDQNGVAHTVPVPVPTDGTPDLGAVMIQGNGDGTVNTLQVTPSPDSP